MDEDVDLDEKMQELMEELFDLVSRYHEDLCSPDIATCMGRIAGEFIATSTAEGSEDRKAAREYVIKNMDLAIKEIDHPTPVSELAK